MKAALREAVLDVFARELQPASELDAGVIHTRFRSPEGLVSCLVLFFEESRRVVVVVPLRGALERGRVHELNAALPMAGLDLDEDGGLRLRAGLALGMDPREWREVLRRQLVRVGLSYRMLLTAEPSLAASKDA